MKYTMMLHRMTFDSHCKCADESSECYPIARNVEMVIICNATGRRQRRRRHSATAVVMRCGVPYTAYSAAARCHSVSLHENRKTTAEKKMCMIYHFNFFFFSSVCMSSMLAHQICVDAEMRFKRFNLKFIFHAQCLLR